MTKEGYLERGFFTELQNITYSGFQLSEVWVIFSARFSKNNRESFEREALYFNQARLFLGSVQWPHEQDFSADTLYLESEVEVDQNIA